MATDVEAIWTALEERIRSRVTDLTTVTRDPSLQYGIEEYPVCAISEGDEVPSLDEDGLPPRLTLEGTIAIVVRADKSSKGVTATKVNALVKAVREALERDVSEDHAESNRHWTDLGFPGLVLTLGRLRKMTSGRAAGEAWAEFDVTVETF